LFFFSGTVAETAFAKLLLQEFGCLLFSWAFYPGSKGIFWVAVFHCPSNISYVSSCSVDDEGFNVGNVAELESDLFVSNSVFS
jgi:hypothetical protein